VKKWLERLIPIVVLALLFSLVPAPAFAINTADVTVNATPEYLSISVSPTTYAFGFVAESATPSTTTSYFTITNGSSVATNNTVSVTSATWTGGTPWTHSDTATPNADTVGLKANKGGTWGTGDVIVKFTSSLSLAASQAATTDWSFGLKLLAPTSFSDGALKTNTVRITATKQT